MDEVSILKEQIKVLEVELSDANSKLNLNRQYSATLEEKLEGLDNNQSVNYNVEIILVLVIVIILLCKKNLVLSKSKKCL